MNKYIYSYVYSFFLSFFVLSSHLAFAQALDISKVAIQGRVTASTEGAIEGAVISAKKDGSVITISSVM
jgi:hypothetical protein